MKKIALKSAAVLTVALMVAPVLASTVNAAETDKSLSTKGYVTFEQGDGKPPIGDPEDPEDEKPDPKPKPDGTEGPLSLDFASSLFFGKQKIDTAEATYYAHVQGYESGDIRPNFVQVTDKRGTLAGWSLSVKTGSQFYTGIDPTKVTEANSAPGDYLLGAQISFTQGQVTSAAKTGTPTDVSQAVTLGNAAVNLVTAHENEGMGTWIYKLGETKDAYDTEAKSDDSIATKGPITLEVPANSTIKAAAYETDLIWTLSQTPAN